MRAKFVVIIGVRGCERFGWGGKSREAGECVSSHFCRTRGIFLVSFAFALVVRRFPNTRKTVGFVDIIVGRDEVIWAVGGLPPSSPVFLVRCHPHLFVDLG